MSKKHYSQPELFIRSLLYSIFSITTIVLYCTLLICTFFVPLHWTHAMARAYLKVNLNVLKFLCHIDYTVEGLENIPQDEVGVVLCKHQSTWETFFIGQIFHAPAVIVKRELLWLPFFGWALALSGPISINRQEKLSAMQQVIAKGKKYLAQKRWVVIFPEGTRIPIGMVGRYRLGGARLAVATGSFVIPVAHNAGRFWPRRQFIKQPGTVHVVIGPRIESKGRTSEEVLAIAKDWIETTITRIDKV